MAHFAKLENNIVVDIIVVANEMLYNSEGIEVEQIGIDFCKSLYGNNTNWIQVSYNDNIRKQYPGIGFIYDQTNDVFLEPKPFESWTLNSDLNWQSPTSYPDDNKAYDWNEEALSWDLFTPDSPFPSWVWNETQWMWEAPVAHPNEAQAYEWNEESQTWGILI